MGIAMVPLLAETASAYVAAGFGLAGSLIGGLIAGTVSLRVARQAREAAESSWIRDSRRWIFDRLLTEGQRLLIACVACRSANRSTETKEAVEEAHRAFFEVYGVVQTVSERDVVDASRAYGYRLLELRESLDDRGYLGPRHFDEVAQLVRRARHDTIDAMRIELGLTDSARPPEGYNPFVGTPLGDEYQRRRYGSG
jgi:hypothetical protein